MATDLEHSRAVSVLIVHEGESLPITGSPQLSTQEQQLSIPRLPTNSQHVDVDDESKTNIYHIILESPIEMFLTLMLMVFCSCSVTGK